MEMRSRVQEAREDVFFGQIVMIWARWAVIATATVVTVWTAGTEWELARGIFFVVVLMALNFYLHGRHLVERPANRLLIELAALVDLVVIAGLIVVASPSGYSSQLFLLFYPVLLGFALVFPPRIACTFGGAAVVLYLATFAAGFPADQGSFRETLMRLITLAAMVGLGTFYWRAQRERRRRAEAR